MGPGCGLVHGVHTAHNMNWAQAEGSGTNGAARTWASGPARGGAEARNKAAAPWTAS
jgi:hypothetical protein